MSDNWTLEPVSNPPWHAVGTKQPNPISDRRPNPSEHPIGGMQ